jgi:hypothetical protein
MRLGESVWANFWYEVGSEVGREVMSEVGREVMSEVGREVCVPISEALR